MQVDKIINVIINCSLQDFRNLGAGTSFIICDSALRKPNHEFQLEYIKTMVLMPRNQNSKGMIEIISSFIAYSIFLLTYNI